MISKASNEKCNQPPANRVMGESRENPGQGKPWIRVWAPSDDALVEVAIQEGHRRGGGQPMVDVHRIEKKKSRFWWQRNDAWL